MKNFEYYIDMICENCNLTLNINGKLSVCDDTPCTQCDFRDGETGCVSLDKQAVLLKQFLLAEYRFDWSKVEKDTLINVSCLEHPRYFCNYDATTDTIEVYSHGATSKTFISTSSFDADQCSLYEEE